MRVVKSPDGGTLVTFVDLPQEPASEANGGLQLHQAKGDGAGFWYVALVTRNGGPDGRAFSLVSLK